MMISTPPLQLQQSMLASAGGARTPYMTRAVHGEVMPMAPREVVHDVLFAGQGSFCCYLNYTAWSVEASIWIECRTGR